MRLIICEKQLAARRIAEILSDGDCVEKKSNKLFYYEFGDNLVVGLSGHVVNIDFPKEYSSWSMKSLDSLVDSKLIVIEEREDIISMLKFLAKQSDEAVISTDYDSEGELIGVEAVDIIKSVNPRIRIIRAVFSAITDEEIKDSFSKPVSVNKPLADAAGSRREIDLIWGAVLTRFVSLVSKRLGKNFLSVGRVQTPVLLLIVERETERLNFKPETYWELPLTLSKGNENFTAYYIEPRVFDKSLVKKILSIKSNKAVIKSVSQKESSTKPPLPFNTTDYLREASRFGISTKRAMSIAEALYLNGYVSYPRTDNQVYPESINIKKILQLLSKSSYGDYIKKIKDDKPTAGKSTKDHPPIHPTGIIPKGLKGVEAKVYDLIVRRFLATLSKPSVEKTVNVGVDYSGYDFVSRGLRILDKGWREIYPFSKLTENFLPELAQGESVNALKLLSIEKQTQPPKRYGQGSIIKIMSELGLGTKSTRPDIIQKLIDRLYISPKFVPSPIAFAVVNSLKKYANKITDPGMTSELESSMELISTSEQSKDVVVNSSRKLLHTFLKGLIPNKDAIGEVIREALRKAKVVGKCPDCGSDLIIRVSRRTRKRFIGCSGYPKCHHGWPLPQSGLIHVLPDNCDCGIHRIMLIRKARRPFVFCPNLLCETKKAEEAKWNKTAVEREGSLQ